MDAGRRMEEVHGLNNKKKKGDKNNMKKSDNEFDLSDDDDEEDEDEGTFFCGGIWYLIFFLVHISCLPNPFTDTQFPTFICKNNRIGSCIIT